MTYYFPGCSVRYLLRRLRQADPQESEAPLFCLSSHQQVLPFRLTNSVVERFIFETVQKNNAVKSKRTTPTQNDVGSDRNEWL